jgi:hypothetical protein
VADIRSPHHSAGLRFPQNFSRMNKKLKKDTLGPPAHPRVSNLYSLENGKYDKIEK